jgi:SHS2 domain-containing protein
MDQRESQHSPQQGSITRAEWHHFPHRADIGVQGIGATLAEAFEQAAIAMTAVICDVETVAAKHSVEITCEASDAEMLLVDWLNALVYEMATRNMLFSRFEVQIEGGRLQATVWGEALDPKRHQPAVEVKGATYTALKVGQQEDGRWFAQCVVDV